MCGFECDQERLRLIVSYHLFRFINGTCAFIRMVPLGIELSPNQKAIFLFLFGLHSVTGLYYGLI